MTQEEPARHHFITPYGEPRPNWLEAFPGLSLSNSIAAPRNIDVMWILLPNEGEVTEPLTECRFAAGNVPVVALSDVPTDEQGMIALGVGVAGYCNGHAAPEVLRQVAVTVLSGGVWVGQSLLQRLIDGMASLAAKKFSPPPLSDWASSLTEREVDTARAVAAGANNKEIARQLGITERTVKAHLGSIFDKLKVRDRLQLTLLVNGVIKA